MLILIRRAPYGARGLKSSAFAMLTYSIGSRPVWGAWIEMALPEDVPAAQAGRAPYGARGLKFYTCTPISLEVYVAPRMGRVD